MAKANPIQTNFTSGEISPLLYGRVDIQKYFNGAKKLRNFIIKPQGGAFARPGTIFTIETKDSSKKSILVEFEFSDTQAYVLEFGNLYIRFIKNNAQLSSSGTPVEVVTPYIEDELKYIQYVQSGDILYLVHPAHRPMKLLRFSDTSWSLVTLTTTDGPYLPTNSTETQLRVFNIIDRATLTSSANDFVVGDVNTFVTYSYQGEFRLGKIVAYLSATQVTIEPYDNIISSVDPAAKLTYTAGAPNTVTASLSIFTNSNVGAYIRVGSGWYLVITFNSETSLDVAASLTMKTTTGILTFTNRVLTASVSATADTFASTDVGRHIRFNFLTEQVWGTITAYSGVRSVTVDLDRDVPLSETDPTKLRGDGVTSLWRLGAWSDGIGYPSCVAFHEERLCFAASPEEPQTVWMSVSGDYENFAPTGNDSAVLDDSAITYTIASNKINAIKWLDSGPTLVIGTLGAEWQVRSSSLNEPITPTNITVTQQTGHGSGFVRPVRIGSAILFVQRSGRKIRELYYDFQVDALVARDITIVNEHILRNGGSVVDAAYQQEPNSVLWVVLSNGQLAGLTYVKDQEVYAWHLHEIGGSFGNTSWGIVESVCSIPLVDGTSDQLFMIVKRTINGITKRYIERLGDELNITGTVNKTDMHFVDCGVVYSGSATTSLSVSHLESQVVDIIANGAVRPSQIVTSGVVSIGTEATDARAGLHYQSTLVTLPPEAGAQFGTAQGKTKRINQMTVKVLNSLGFKYGPSEQKLTQYSFRSTTDPMDQSPGLRSEDVRTLVDDNYGLAPSITIVRDQPYPLNILCVMPELKTND